LNAYLDTSVLLRHLLRQSNALAGWTRIRVGVTSRLAETEGARTLDRMRVEGLASEKQTARAREAFLRMIESVEVVELSRVVLRRAAAPLPVTLGTLDAVHLTSALMWQEREQKSLTFATHDASLALAASSLGFRIIGV